MYMYGSCVRYEVILVFFIVLLYFYLGQIANALKVSGCNTTSCPLTVCGNSSHSRSVLVNFKSYNKDIAFDICTYFVHKNTCHIVVRKDCKPYLITNVIFFLDNRKDDLFAHMKIPIYTNQNF